MLVVVIILNSGHVFVGDKGNVIRDVRKLYVNKRMVLFYLSTHHVSSQMFSMFSFTDVATSKVYVDCFFNVVRQFLP